MNDTTNRQQNPIQDDETTSPPNIVNAAGVETSRASTSAASCSSNPNQSNVVLSSSSFGQHSNLTDEEEQVVTSTSNENFSTTPYPYSQTNQLHNFVTSPARITSSTGYDYSSSPIQQHITTQRRLSTSEDDSSEQQQQQQQQQEEHQQQEQQQQRRLKEEEVVRYSALNAAMPTTSAAAAANISKNKNHERVPPSYNHLTSTRRTQEACDRPSTSQRRKSTETGAIETSNNMVARDSGNNLGGSGSNNTPGHDHVEKIILKLPKQNESPSVQYQTRQKHQQQEEQQHQQQEHFLDNDPSMSNSCSNSSTNSSIIAEADTRKVEPLKINLLHGNQQQQQHLHQYHHHHHHHGHQQSQHHHSPSSSGSSSTAVPKITIKPLFPPKTSSEGCAAFSSDSKATAESETSPSNNVPTIPKLTIKATSENMSSEPHIVPKLTIRAAHEEGGSTHTSVVPKLTIKMSDTQTPHNSTLPPPNAVNSTGDFSHHHQQQQQQQQPPLPKLTIKTTLDGASGSSILSSSISPYSNSSSSVSTSPQSTSSSAAAALTKMTLKTNLQSKSKEESQTAQPVVPKLTIKTSPSGSCVTTSSATITETSIPDAILTDTVNKIPKLTIKTGQEHHHAVIITTQQHKNEQHIPKLTIKTTKSLEIEDDDDPSHNKEPEKIPKITIKDSLPPPIPKLTISTPHSPKLSHNSSGSASSLVVRQVAMNTHVPTTETTTTTPSSSSSKTQSPDRVPKLMISRQEAMINHGRADSPNEKIVPKLTIKTTTSSSSITAGDQVEEHHQNLTKIPKLKIKTLTTTNSSKEELQSSDDSDDNTSIESAQSSSDIQNEQQQQQQTNKTVPKLTITNLGSPTLRLKTVASNETASLGHKKSAKSASSSNVSQTELNQLKNVEKASASETKASNVVANGGGESSSSQEFCGFTENTTDSTMAAPSQVDNLKKVTNKSPVEEIITETRRTSDDMDIDEGLQSHDPKIFKNITHFGAIRNGEVYGIHMDNNMERISELNIKDSGGDEVVDMVDLTSSPSPGSSPAHFNYTDADPKLPEFLHHAATPQSNALLLECLQRETSVIQTATRIAHTSAIEHNRSQLLMATTTATSKDQSNSLLLSQLTAPLRYPPPPPLHPRPSLHPQPNLHPHMFNVAASTLNYSPLNERILANGAHAQFSAAPLLRPPQNMPSNSMHNLTTTTTTTTTKQPPPTTVIDSIEILDTPEGSPRSSQDDSQSVGEFPNRSYMDQTVDGNATEESTLHHNNIRQHMSATGDPTNNSSTLKRSAKEICNYTNNDCLTFPPNKMRRTENMTPTMATLTILTNDNTTNSATLITTSPTIIGGVNDNHCMQSTSQSATNSHHRSRKQKHDNILDVPFDEIDQIAKNTIAKPNFTQVAATPEVVTPAPVPKKRGRPRRIRPEEQQAAVQAPITPTVNTPDTPNLANASTAERRVQLLRKRLAIDMVSAEQPVVKPLDGTIEISTPVATKASEEGKIRRERAIRTTRRCATPNSLLNSAEKQQQASTTSPSATKQRKQRFVNATLTTPTSNMSGNCDVAAGGSGTVNSFNHFGGSNSSLSSACSSNSSFSTTLTTTATTAAFMGTVNCNFSSMSSQIDLTMSSSSSSSAGSGATTATLTTVTAGGANSMLPPIKALSSSDPLPDVVFQSKDFSAIMLTQQLNAGQSSPSSRKNSRANSQEGDELSGSVGSGSGDDSTSPLRTPGRGRGRGRGRGLRGGPRGHRLGRGASAVAKAIALSRPRCVGGLKHTPDPERMKSLFTPSPQVFEEDTRMSADMSQMQTNIDPPTPIRQPDFLSTNEEESQSSIISNTSVSILDPNTVAAVQNGANVKRPKKKRLEVCATEEVEYTVSSIAEYDWPPPKGCCPSKNRDTFMIQEQVANYLGIKSFKRKYPDLPRRQIDMEERNWLQEKGLVTEKMCDLGITAVWASDILDIMHADFYDKYEQYKDYIRRKHLREIESKQKSLGLNIGGRGLQARDRAMLSASKWNTYFNKTRKDERSNCLDLQNLMVNVPLPANVPATTLMNRSIVDEISKAAIVESIAEPPTLIKSQSLFPPIEIAAYYPLLVVPGQYASTYKRYNHLELRALPLNTVLDNPLEKESAMTSTAEETDTNESETACETKTNEASSKRLKIRRSRRARSERSTKLNCDSQSEKERPLSSEQSGSLAQIVSDLDSAAESFCESSGSSSSSSESSSDSASTCTSSENEMDSDSEEISTCAVCQRTQNKNPKDLPELFINCYTCDRKVHPSCIEMPYRMVLRVRNYNWQCADCKCCIKCKRKQDPNKMLYCEQCDRGFHIYCLGVKSVSDSRWSCERCSVCIRCGATKPEGLPQQPEQLSSQNGEKVKQIKHKKVKWINEYRIDHITKLREHCSMLCVRCGRSRSSAKRLQQIQSGANCNPIKNQGNSSGNSSLSLGFCSSTAQQQQNSPQIKSQLNPDSSIASKSSESSSSSATPMNSNAVETSPSPPPPPVVA